MNILKKSLCLVLAFLLFLPLAPQVRAENEAAVAPYAQQMLQYYLTYQDAAQTDIERLLYEMGTIDASQADAWQSIMDYWSQVRNSPLHPDVLPDGLPEDDSLCIVVLGYALASDGSMQSELIGRLKVALASAEKYPNAYILCTGGGTAANNSKVTEAGEMASWLIRNGVEASRVITETRSMSTSQNATYSYKILRDQYPQVRHLAMVTSDYHMSWGYMAFATALSLGVYTDLDPHMDIISNAVYTINPRRNNLSNEHNQILQVSGLRSSGQSAGALSQLSSLSVRGSLRYYVGDDLNLTVIAGYDNGFFRDVTAAAQITDVEMRLPGTRTIQIHYEENGTQINTAVVIELLPLAEGAPHPSEPEVVLVEESLTEPVSKGNQPLPLYLVAAILILLLILLTLLIHKKKKAQRRRRRKKMYI